MQNYLHFRSLNKYNYPVFWSLKKSLKKWAKFCVAENVFSYSTFSIHLETPLGIFTLGLGTTGLQHKDTFMQYIKNIWINREPLTHAGTYISVLCASLQLSLQPSQGETDWGDYWLLPFRLTQAQCGHKLTILPAHCLHWNHSPSSQRALRCPAECTLFHYDRSDSSVTLHSLRLFFVSIMSSSIFSSASLMLSFQSYAISLSIPFCVSFFLPPNSFFSIILPSAKHLASAWQFFCLDISPCHFCDPNFCVGVLTLRLPFCMS